MTKPAAFSGPTPETARPTNEQLYRTAPPAHDPAPLIEEPVQTFSHPPELPFPDLPRTFQRFFDALDGDVPLHLMDVNAYKSGMVALRYEVRGPRKGR